MPGEPSEATKSGDAPAPAPADLGRSMLRLLRSLAAFAPARAGTVVAISLALIVTSGVNLVMLVPLLGVAGLDVGEGSLGRIGAWVAGALSTVGLSLTVPVVLVVYLVVVAGNAVLTRAHAVHTAALYQGFTLALRQRVFEAITYCRWASFVGESGPRFLHALTEEAERVSAALASTLNLTVKAVMATLYLALAVMVAPAATLLVVACGGALVALLAGRTRLGRAKGETVSQVYEALYGAISEHLAGLRITKSYGVEPARLRHFAERARDASEARIDLVRNQADVGFWLEVGSAVIMAGVFGAALLVFEMPLASILLILYLFARLVPMVTGLQREAQFVLNLLPASDRVEASLRWLGEHAEAMGPTGDVPTLAHGLRLERVAFGYHGTAGESVLRDVDLEVPTGRTTAIVGPSGGGKSTVADVVVGLITPDAGRVLVDGVPLAGGRVAAWRGRIGYVNQDTFLFNDTIRANLLLVRPEASDDELLDALRSASAAFVAGLPDGLDTVVGDRGVRLSGGERQRVALARAIVRRPAMLVLDEATSALDPENERIIQEAIGRMAGRQTILLIAHRLASVRAADTIHVMEQGRIVESGTWDALVQRPHGRFRELCVAQGLVAQTRGATASEGSAVLRDRPPEPDLG